MIKKELIKPGMTFWYVKDALYNEKDENGNVIMHKEFFTIPKILDDEDISYQYNIERMFLTESEANMEAFKLTNSEGF